MLGQPPEFFCLEFLLQEPFYALTIITSVDLTRGNQAFNPHFHNAAYQLIASADSEEVRPALLRLLARRLEEKSVDFAYSAAVPKGKAQVGTAPKEERLVRSSIASEVFALARRWLS